MDWLARQAVNVSEANFALRCNHSCAAQHIAQTAWHFPIL
jgi:hypothetical protein